VGRIKNNLPTIMVVVLLIFGFGMLFYPDISTWWNGRIQSGIVDQYTMDVAAMQQEQIERQLQRAAEINNEIARHQASGAPFLIGPVAPLPEDYLRVLNVNGVMGRIQIPVIDVDLPIRHTTTHAVLDIGVGHLEGTSLPIGGIGTHAALTAHTALPNARLFSDLEGNVNIGDYFFIEILNQRLAYQVVQIDVVFPHEIHLLPIVPGEDFVTLITCTPYAINTERLLVRGSRVPYEMATPADEIVSTFVVTRVDTRVYIFIAFFLLFMVIFTVYQALNNDRVIKRKGATMPVAVPASSTKEMDTGASVANNVDTVQNVGAAATTSGAPVGGIAPIGVAAIASATALPSPEPTPTSTAPDLSLVMPIPVLPRKAEYKSGYKPTTKFSATSKNKGRNIAIICVAAVALIAGAGFMFLRQQGSAPSADEAIAGFVTRVEDFNASHNDRVVAQMMEHWQATGEFEYAPDIIMDESAFSGLLQRVNEHNRNLYESGQPSLPDPFEYSQSGFNLSHFGFDEDMIGYMAIPSMDIVLPIFMGASRENLHRGLAHVTDTSLPIGGASTNAIIAGHTDIGRNQILNGVESLEIGDKLLVTNFYETLTYTIIDIQQVNPQQTEALMIQSGRDLLTLLAYQNGRDMRHMVVAQRSET